VESIYHRQVLERAIGGLVSQRALGAILVANLDQDSLRGLTRPEFHFDNSLFTKGLAYMETARKAAAHAADPIAAWDAFGRLSHAAQDFYSHSNYVALWLEEHSAAGPAGIDGLDPLILRDPRLMSGRVYLPLEALTLFAALRPLLKPLLPRDSHAWMNLDSPETGPLFPYSIEAAVQRTVAEFERTLAVIGEEQGEAAMAAFLDH
jgi:hypothetical protein